MGAVASSCGLCLGPIYPIRFGTVRGIDSIRMRPALTVDEETKNVPFFQEIYLESGVISVGCDDTALFSPCLGY